MKRISELERSTFKGPMIRIMLMHFNLFKCALTLGPSTIKSASTFYPIIQTNDITIAKHFKSYVTMNGIF